MAVTMYCPFLTVDYKDKNGKLRIKCERGCKNGVLTCKHLNITK